MRYIKFYENFIVKKEADDLIDIDIDKELTDKTIDDVLSDDFFDDEYADLGIVKKDNRGVYHITGWKTY